MKAASRSVSMVLIVVVGLICLQLSASAQVVAARNHWVKQAPIPTWFSLQGIVALSPTECWIASAPLLDDVGELARGASWASILRPLTYNFAR
jgi:hypothetical protein